MICTLIIFYFYFVIFLSSRALHKDRVKKDNHNMSKFCFPAIEHSVLLDKFLKEKDYLRFFLYIYWPGRKYTIIWRGGTSLSVLRDVTELGRII